MWTTSVLEAALHTKFSDKKPGLYQTYFYQSERGLPGATIYYNLTNFPRSAFGTTRFHAGSLPAWIFAEMGNSGKRVKYNRGYLRYLDPVVLNSDGKTENTYTQNEIYGSVSTLFRAFENISFSASSDISGNTLDAAGSGFASPSRLSWLTVLAGKYVSNRCWPPRVCFTLTLTSRRKQATPPKISENFRRISVYRWNHLQPPICDFGHFTRISFGFLPSMICTIHALVIRTWNPRTPNSSIWGDLHHHFQWVIAVFSVTADAYHNRIDNKIVAYPTKISSNGPCLITAGLISTDWIFTGSGLQDCKGYNLIAGGSYTYQRALNVTNPDDRDYNQQIPYTPRVSGSGRASLKLRG